MFTGIVSAVGEVATVEARAASARIAIAEAGTAARLHVGASLAVNGCCLTVTSLASGLIHVEAVPETMARTTIGALRPRSRVNLELAVEAGGRLDGHLLQGHVDGVAGVASVSEVELGREISFRAPSHLMRYVAEKGSIGLDGVSLTVAWLDAERAAFGIAFIPHTLAATRAGGYRAGAVVNMEVDVIARYVERLLGGRAQEGGRAPGPGML